MSVFQREAIVREAGGIGDILCLASALVYAEIENPQTRYSLFIPDDFIEIANHITTSEIVGLGRIVDIRGSRRPRDVDMDSFKQDYLTCVYNRKFDAIHDAFCPPYLNESTEAGFLEFTRCQLFGIALGLRRVEQVRPTWKLREDEVEAATLYLETQSILPGRFVVVCPKGTCSARSYPPSYLEKLLELLHGKGINTLLAGIHRNEKLCKRMKFCDQSFNIFAAILSQAQAIISVDSCPLHLAQALRIPTVGIFSVTDPYPFLTSYNDIVAITPMNSDCKMPCNYSRRKGWRETCRDRGCNRMTSLTPERVSEALLRLL